ncbi:hypothetical protein LOAG_07295 [Loa loa]|uniref:Uncharacterized protein n=1 Tax=Loa loa TaxID=7209 RepID=A0A1S0TW21_LOALO|nr:hypothetical protein LOAG_07295 [Loa loa]EFO21195.1 hypothetical protein LOAG_07295 [Loa loa]
MEDAKSEQAVKPMSGHLRDQPVFLQIYGNTRKLLVHLREGGLSTEKKPPNFRDNHDHKNMRKCSNDLNRSMFLGKLPVLSQTSLYRWFGLVATAGRGLSCSVLVCVSSDSV